MRAWEEGAIEVACRYMNEPVFELLGQFATPRVIPALQLLLDRIGPWWAESKDIAHAIERIRRRAQVSATKRRERATGKRTVVRIVVK
jgi:hypothetical protein